ncbi:helix-turn-helix transcriptional regulator [Actinoplanes sp. NBC_00393]|uniref:PadR family transcriptional regulator n=1 Tax=Actinoplanes sp. NBC_00393 TaxID=2975953 RepID=UPI002E1D402A
MIEADDAERHTQLLRGALDMCLLALLSGEPAHGYELVRRVEAAGFGAVSYGTVYPLLTRMRRLGLVADEQQVSPAGPPRKVYALTSAGRTRLDAWQRQWTRFADRVGAVLAASSPATEATSRATSRAASGAAFSPAAEPASGPATSEPAASEPAASDFAPRS